MKREVSPGGLSFIRAGSGRPLLFIHGWAMASTVWTGQLSYFAERGFDALALDLRGHGESIAEGPFTLPEFAYDLKGFIHELGLANPILIGWSMGAMVILDYLSAHPRGASAFCLVGGSPKFTASDDYPHGLPLHDVKGMKVKLKRDFKRSLREFRFRITNGLTAELRRRVVDALPPDYAAAKGGLNELLSVDLRPLLERIDLPSLLIHGSDDRVCPAGAAASMAGRLRQAELCLIDGAGHVPFLSHEARFNGALETFARRHLDSD